MNDDFYIGWEDKAPPGSGRPTRRLVLGFLALVLLAGAILAASQRRIGVAYFEWGQVREFTGILRITPYPHLVVSKAAAGAGHTLQSVTAGPEPLAAPLVAPFKFGVAPEAVCGFDGRTVTLRATRIHRDNQLMLELQPGSVQLAVAADAPLSPTPATVSLGRHTLRGEIVDSKCWMGVMNPGVLAPHRACAVRCISGGIPPMLLVRRQNGPPLNLLLSDPAGRPVNDRVLDWIAEPIEITGEIVRDGDILSLRADPASFRRLGL